MWSTPSSIARRSTARAAPGSPGDPKTPGPASCIAPKPMRLIGLSPRNVVVSMSIFCWDVPDFEELQAEGLDLRQDAEHRGAVLEHAGEHGLAALALGSHRRKRREGRSSEPALDPDRVQAPWRGHASILRPDPVSRRRRDPVIVRAIATALARPRPRGVSAPWPAERPKSDCAHRAWRRCCGCAC